MLGIHEIFNLTAGTLSSVLKVLFFAKILCSHFILQALFQSAQHLYVKKKGSGAGSIPLTNRSGSGSRSGSPIRIVTVEEILLTIYSANPWANLGSVKNKGVEHLSSVTLRMQKKIFFIFFSYNLPADTLSSIFKMKFFAKILYVKIFILQALFQSAQHLYEKKGKNPDPDPYLLTNGFGSGRPKNKRFWNSNTDCN